MDKDDVPIFFANISPALLESFGDYIYNYEETNVSDDLGVRKLIVPGNCKRMERVQFFSETATRIMVCGNASGALLPPMLVYFMKNGANGALLKQRTW